MMKKIRAVSAYFFAIGLGAMLASAVTCKAAWEGVDKNVVEKFAEKAGRPPRKPLIHTDQGDLLLFVFLLAGITGGFIGGYLFRGLFAPPKRPRQEAPDDV
jgi:hypothetical protein